MDQMMRLDGVAKSFTMHLRGGAELPVVRDVSFEVAAGECVALGGPSGAGKSSILKMIYGNYRADRGEIWLRDGGEWIDVARAAPRRMLRLRKSAIGYVSQFLRAIPRVSSLDLVVAAAREGGAGEDEAKHRAADLLARLNLPERLWSLPPATFSGGEQQRVNVARGFAAGQPMLLLDEPTASLDAASRARVVALIAERRKAGTAILGIFHDEAVRNEIADRTVDVTRFAA
ncbi:MULTISPECIES: phosphonate C-P lyase system protein PhnL [Rhodomicrobium]|uniref:phosphonate C-P lyase system protein PhnL n=1 Tax=Rhodomicrobium TaxID=1068 RepID=UPI000B4A62AF|nr:MULTISPECIES: phosphonate C-P lyase system protein PhnL [Rhodomicrobium]